MKRLIINADDVGADEARNAGIFEAAVNGIVTSVSILANGPAFDDAIKHIRLSSKNDVSYGIHINLSEGRPISSGLRIITGSDGLFLGKSFAIELFSRNNGQAFEKDIITEIDAQMKMLINAGIKVSHIDGHHHIHIFPAVINATISVAKRYNIPWIRIPEEKTPSYDGLSVNSEIISEAGLFSRFGSKARPLINATGIDATEHFRGLYLKGRLSLPILEEFFKKLPDGLTEFMTHPGNAVKEGVHGYFTRFSTPDREKELKALLHPGFREMIEKYNIILTPFPEV